MPEPQESKFWNRACTLKAHTLFSKNVSLAAGSGSANTIPGTGQHNLLHRMARQKKVRSPSKYSAVTIIWIVLAGALPQASATGPTTEEYRAKGAFLLNFVKFVEWPGEAFKGPGDPIAVCILGTNLFGAGTDEAAKTIVVGKRSVTVRQIPDEVQARQCQIVFLSLLERRRVRAVIDAVQGGNVLTVGETDGFVARGGVIELSVNENRIRIEISSTAAKKAGLRISSKLLSLALVR